MDGPDEHSAPRACGLIDRGIPCGGEADADAPLDLCPEHLVIAYEWMARDAGVTDLLPFPCRLCGSRVGVRYPTGWICAVCEWRADTVPDGELAPLRVDVVYYLRFADRVKIGTSVNPRLRIAALPHHEVLAFELGGRSLERIRHAQFAEHRIPGTEWFEANESLASHVAALQDGVIDPWDRYAFWLSRAHALERGE